MIDDIFEDIARVECEKRLEVKYPSITDIMNLLTKQAPAILFDEVVEKVVEK